MKKRTKLAAGAGAALAVAGAGGAVAAAQLSPSEESKAVVADAAKQLGVDPAKLTDALQQALRNRIDQAVENGSLTQEQADALKQRLEDGGVPLVGVPGFGHVRGGGLILGHGVGDLAAAATYLGLTQAELRQALAAGKTLAQVAKDEGKSVDGLVGALVQAETKRLDQAVADGRLTKAQRDQLVATLEQRTRARVNGARPSSPGRPGGHGGFGFGFGHEQEEAPPAPAA